MRDRAGWSGYLMDVVVEGHVKGAFSGWGQGKEFVLDRGTHRKWRQVEDRYEFRYAFKPKAKVLRDGSRFYLEVEGMDDMVEVAKA